MGHRDEGDGECAVGTVYYDHGSDVVWAVIGRRVSLKV